MIVDRARACVDCFERNPIAWAFVGAVWVLMLAAGLGAVIWQAFPAAFPSFGKGFAASLVSILGIGGTGGGLWYFSKHADEFDRDHNDGDSICIVLILLTWIPATLCAAAILTGSWYPAKWIMHWDDPVFAVSVVMGVSIATCLSLASLVLWASVQRCYNEYAISLHRVGLDAA